MTATQRKAFEARLRRRIFQLLDQGARPEGHESPSPDQRRKDEELALHARVLMAGKQKALAPTQKASRTTGPIRYASLHQPGNDGAGFYSTTVRR